MSKPQSFTEIINLWPSLTAFANDLGVPYVTANLMRQRNNIHPRHWVRLMQMAKRRGYPITAELLAHLAALERA